jgi:hypothetical protein
VQWFEGRGERLWLYGFKNADQGHSDVLGLSSPPPCGYGFAREIQPAAQADPPDCPTVLSPRCRVAWFRRHVPQYHDNAPV